MLRSRRRARGARRPGRGTRWRSSRNNHCRSTFVLCTATSACASSSPARLEPVLGRRHTDARLNEHLDAVDDHRAAKRLEDPCTEPVEGGGAHPVRQDPKRRLSKRATVSPTRTVTVRRPAIARSTSSLTDSGSASCFDRGRRCRQGSPPTSRRSARRVRPPDRAGPERGPSS